MKIGVQLPEIERQVTWPELWAMARVAEDGGLDSLWVGDHLLYHQEGEWKGPWEAWTTLAALAAVTERVELGPLVAATPFHPPVVLAKMALTLHEISGGRFVLGLGAGWLPTDFGPNGLPGDRLVSRFEEAFTIIRRLLSEGEAEFEGEHYSVAGARLRPWPPSGGGPPLMVGAHGPRMLRATLPHVDRWTAWYDEYENSPEGAAGLLARIDEAAETLRPSGAPVAKTLCTLFQFGPDSSRRDAINPVVGEDAQLRALDAYRDLSVSHLHLVLDPITVETVERTADLVRRWRRG